VKPNFTGEWVLDREGSSLAGGAAAMETGFMRIDHRDPKCRFQMSMNVEAKLSSVHGNAMRRTKCRPC